MATTTPNFGWTVPTSSDLVKNGATAIETLGDAIDASLVDLKGGTTGQVLSKTSGTDMDFTWASPTASSSGVTLISTTTFSGVATQSFNNVFSSTYANYLITYNIVAADTTHRGIYLRYRASGSDATSSYAGNMGAWNIEGTTQTYNEVIDSTTFTQLGFSSSSTAIQRLLGSANIYNPNVASQYTALIGQAISEKSGAYKGGYQTYSMQTATTQFDGFTLYASAGNISGTVRIYGLGNS